MDINKLLKVLFILSAITFLVTFIFVPQDDCDTCTIKYEGRVIEPVRAFEIFEDACISRDKPWDALDFSGLNFTNITFTDVYLE